MKPNAHRRAAFLIFLILSLPFYSAQVFADLAVTRNTGNAGVPNFIDAAGDTWTLEVSARNTGSVAPSQLTVNGFAFDRCTAAAGGTQLCTYEFDYEDTRIFEAAYPLDIRLRGSESAAAQVTADGSAPSVTNVVAQQAGDLVQVAFTVQERPASCVGLQRIELRDASGGAVLKSLEGSELAGKVPAACGASTLIETVTLSGTSSGPRTVRVTAADRLNHSAGSSSNSFLFDRVAPNIIENSFRVGEFSSFVPAALVSAPLSVEVGEAGSSLFVNATSAKLRLDNEPASCSRTDVVNNTFTCRWPERQVETGQSVSVVVSASDGNNRQTKTLSVNLAVDSTAPVVQSFGTAQQVSGRSIAKPQNNTLVAVLAESQSGMRKERVKADLSGINALYGTRQADDCTLTGSLWRCSWSGISVQHSGTIALVEARDAVGNAAQPASAEIELDTAAPVIGEVLITALAGQSAQSRDFFQSRDVLRVTFEVADATPVKGRADVSGIVSNGSIVQAACTRQAEKQVCTLVTDRIKSGYVPDAQLVLIAEDVAGNIGQKTVSIEILGTDLETQPDFWSVGGVRCSPEGLDASTVKLASQRVFCTVPLESGSPDVTILSTQLVSCAGDSEKLARAFAINNFAGSTAPQLVLELAPFEGAGAPLSYDCTLRVFSRRGTSVVQQPEEEHVNVSVRFFTTPFDRELSTIEDEIDSAKEAADSGFYGIIGTLNTILKWAKALCNILKFIIFVFRAVMNGLQSATDLIRNTVFGTAYAVFHCKAVGEVRDRGEEYGVKALTVFCKVASCRTSTLEVFGGDVAAFGRAQVDRVSKWQGYKPLGFAGPDGSFPGAEGSIVTSVATLCLPGIIYNLEKLRQIDCRYVDCLENEVKAGVATIEACRELRDYQECKYFWGEVFQIIPFVGVLDHILNTLKSALTDPVGLLRAGVAWLCSTVWCPTSGTGAAFCNVAAWVFGIADIAQDIASMVAGFKTIKQDYCSRVL